MSEVCPKCGLPKPLCVCESIAKETQKIEVKLQKMKFGKIHTIISGIEDKNISLKELAKKLKSEFACGGTHKNGVIDLQGNHKERVRQVLTEMGFSL
ncbi:translation initiation factor [Candidatus Woesearchaeota archaeon]|nr:translation initiation factor [Candidatus Woesearchaeota archaeon]